MGQIMLLNRVVRISPVEKQKLHQSLEGGGELVNGHLRVENSRQRKQVDPKVEVCLVCSRKRMASVAGADRMRTEVGDSIR